LPDGWIKEAGASKMIGGKLVPYGYMWWPVVAEPGSINEGAFFARGIFGQAVYINPKENVVIAAWGALPKPTGSAMISDNDFYAALAQAVR
jgi:CubicO group peptidase (beta-lactamase class C family)